ncbi:hypothetical protein ACVMB1_002890 [Bradyrhizobium sp. USDA 4504]
MKKSSSKRQIRRNVFAGSPHKGSSRIVEVTKVHGKAKTMANTKAEARSLTGMVKDDIALYLSPLTAVAGEFRRRLRGA